MNNLRTNKLLFLWEFFFGSPNVLYNFILIETRSLGHYTSLLLASSEGLGPVGSTGGLQPPSIEFLHLKENEYCLLSQS